ncbi:MAG: uracil-DNA glycosylase [Oscillospiraceae bacterium]|nr:uracil-DNA glycosylase [Oscillospiraceae bacterium]
MKDDSEKANCYQCKHFGVSWDYKFPKACKLFGFKSARLPSVTVHESSGAACFGFEKKGD